MLTPSFDIAQEEGCIIVTIRVPYVKISEAEFYSEGNDFKFYCKPYFLHLHLPGQVREEPISSSYDVETSTLVVSIIKCNHGEHFTNLEMLTTLLPRKPKVLGVFTPLIEEVRGSDEVEDGACRGSGEERRGGGGEIDWEREQSSPTQSDKGVDLLSGLVPYGFALQHQGVFLKLQEEIPSIVDCPNPDHMTPHERRISRIACEDVAFSQDHYLADLMDTDNGCIHGILAFIPSWRAELTKWRRKESTSSSTSPHLTGEAGPDIVPFNTEQRDQLKELPNKDYLLSDSTRRSLYLGLVDIIFAYAYDHRCTQGEGNVESAWTICKLSSTLSWMEEFHGNVQEVVYFSVRRTLCYPLYRHWELSLAVLQDTRDLFRLGRRKLIQCVLEIRRILNKCDPYYVLSNLYMSDYGIWLQKASAKQIQKLADELDKVMVDAGSIGWDLLNLEEAALMVAREEESKPSDCHAGGAEIRPPRTKVRPPNLDGVQSIVEQFSIISLQDNGDVDCNQSVTRLKPVGNTYHKPLIEEVTKVTSITGTSSGNESEVETSDDGTGEEMETENETSSGNETENETRCQNENETNSGNLEQISDQSHAL